MISSLTLDNTEDARRAAASRANSVRFDESANNHYGPSRTSMELPTRTGSGLGGHPLSERSLSHRSERGSTSGFGRANSFGLESSRLLGSIHNSPRVSGNPPPGFFVLGPCPSIIRCWLTETFSNDSLLYAALCSGSSYSSISTSLLQKLGLANLIVEENGLKKIRLLVYLTEAKTHLPSSRAASPAPQVPKITAKFWVHESQPGQDKSIQIILGSDVLRESCADISFSHDKVTLFDDDRNQVSMPMVRPENDATYKDLATRPRSRSGSFTSMTAVPSDVTIEHSTPGIIGRPSRSNAPSAPISPTGGPLYVSTRASSGADLGDSSASRVGQMDTTIDQNPESSQPRGGEDSKSTTGSEMSASGPTGSRSASGVWSNSWRSHAGTASGDSSNTSGLFSRPNAPRTMKVLRPGRSMASTSRTTSMNSPLTGTPDGTLDSSRGPFGVSEPIQTPTSATEAKTPVTKSNPIGGASAFGWLNSGQPKKSTTNGSK